MKSLPADPIVEPDALYRDRWHLVYGAAHHAFEFLLARYGDDGPRLVYADFLDESEAPVDQARGALIRVQCALARMADDHPRRPEFAARQAELLHAYQSSWTEHLRDLALGVEFRRGLPDVVAVDAATFLGKGDELFRRAAQPASRLGEVLVNVGAQRLERRHVHDAHLVWQRRAESFLKEPVERGEKRGERLAGSGRRGDQRMPAALD